MAATAGDHGYVSMAAVEGRSPSSAATPPPPTSFDFPSSSSGEPGGKQQLRHRSATAVNASSGSGAAPPRRWGPKGYEDGAKKKGGSDPTAARSGSSPAVSGGGSPTGSLPRSVGGSASDVAAAAADKGDDEKKPTTEYAWRARANTAGSSTAFAGGNPSHTSSGEDGARGRSRHPRSPASVNPPGAAAAGGPDGAASNNDEGHVDAPLLVSSHHARSHSTDSSRSMGRRRRSSSPDARLDDDDDDDPDARPKTKGRAVIQKIKDSTWAVAADLLDHLPNKVAGKLFVPDIPASCLERLLELQEAMLVPFSHDDPTHQALIPALWEALCQTRPPLPMAGEMDKTTWRSELWKDYGFQGVDPATDFRGAGLLGIRSVIWMCVEEPEISRAMLDAGYPFAIAVINVVMALLSILHLTKGKRTCLETAIESANYTAQEARMRLAVIVGEWRCHGPTPGLPSPPRGPTMGSDVVSSLEDGLMNVVAEACRILHGEWQRSKQNIMEFNSVLKAAIVSFERLLRDKEKYIPMSRAIDRRYPEAPMPCAGI